MIEARFGAVCNSVGPAADGACVQRRPAFLHLIAADQAFNVGAPRNVETSARFEGVVFLVLGIEFFVEAKGASGTQFKRVGIPIGHEPRRWANLGSHIRTRIWRAEDVGKVIAARF